VEPEITGDTGFVGVNTRVDPGSLTPGLVSHANNMRFRNGVAETRKGVIKPAWLNATKPELYDEVRNWGKVYGVGNFTDPDSDNFVLIAADGDVYQTRQNNAPKKLALPTGEKVLQDCKFIQAFDKVILFRGRNFKPLVMSSIDDGFSYMLDEYDAATDYTSGNEVAYGPFVSVSSIANSSGQKTCTVTTANDHNFKSNQVVTIAGASLPSTTALSSLTRSSQLATATTGSAHNLSTGDFVVIAGVTGTSGTYTFGKFNGTFEITVTGSTTFTYEVPYSTATDSVSSTASGSATVREIGYNGNHLITVTGDNTFTYEALSGITTTSASGTVTATLSTNFYKRNYPKPLSSITLTANGTYAQTVPTVTINPAAGTVVSVTMKCKSITVTGGGSGYSAGDVLSVAGGTATTTTTIKVLTVNGSGVIQTAELQTVGNYTALPSNAVSVAGGAGTSATFTLSWEVLAASMTNTGSGLFTAPTVTFSATGSDVAATGTAVLGAADSTMDATSTGTVPTNTDYWTQVSNIMPNSSSATYVQNRLVVASAYNTSTFTSDAKVDYIYASDILDEVHTYSTQIFRANKGSDEEIVDIAKASGNEVILFKDRSVDVVTSFYSDLSDVRIDTLLPNVGLAAPRAWAVSGSDVFFFAGRKGIMSIRQNELNSYQGVTVPLSEPIQSLIDRIDYRKQDQVRMAYHDNKLYVAVPFKDLRTVSSQNLITTENYSTISGTPQPLLYSGLTVGNTYYYKLGKNELHIEDNSPKTFTHVRLTDGSFGQFTAGSTNVYFFPNGNSTEVTAQLTELAYGNGNNAILVFDFLNQQWTGYDSGTDISVKEFFKAQYNNTERLFFASNDGYINLVEEEFGGDESFDGTTASQLGISQISSDMTTRGYQAADPNTRMVRRGRINLKTWNPNFTVKVDNEGVEESQTVISNRTKSRTKYYRPSYKADYVVSNTNDDHLDPYREDYSVQLTAAGTAPKSGVDPNRMQETQEKFSASPRRGRYAKVNISNTQGRVELTGVNLDTYGGNKTYNTRS
jgi:hypothetical protein